MSKFKKMDIQGINASLLRTVDECVAVISELEENIARMEQDKYRATSKAIEEDHYSDSEWFGKLNHALRRAKAKRQEVQDRRGVLARQAKENQRITFERAFMDEARRALDPATFKMVYESAQKIANI